MKHLSLISLCSILLLIPGCWSGKRCCYQKTTTEVVTTQESAAQGVQQAQGDVAQDVEAPQAVNAKEDFVADDDEEELRAMEAAKAGSEDTAVDDETDAK